MTPENRQTVLTATVVVLVGLAITALLLVVTRGHGGDPGKPSSSGGRTSAGSGHTDAPAPAPTEVVIDTSDGYALARKAEEILQRSCLPGPVDTTFNVVTYNIHSGHGHRGASLDRIADALRSLHADIVLLQEVDSGRAKTGRVNQPEALAARLDMVSAYGGNARLDGGVIGNAILTRFPLVSAKNNPLPNAGGRQPRGLLHAVIKVEGVELSVFDNHLDFHSDALKARQMARAAQMIATDSLPGIVGGDLNSFPGSGAAVAARSVAQDPFPLVGRGSSATSPADRPRSRIDYLLHRGPGLTPLVTTVPPVLLSDHRPVFASYRLTGQRTCG